MAKKHYKVVWKNQTGAAFSCGVLGPFVVLYTPGKWAQARIGGLLVLDNLKDAIELASGDSQFEIWEVSVKQPVDLPEKRMDTNQMLRHKRVVDSLWLDRKLPDSTPKEVINSMKPWPDGTKAFKHVRLERRIKQ